ncbi:MAG TPA: DNA translocase FtsK 4TM domain-containing protein [Pyrinomonadaceae bacterium]|jgi:S-DNA-T family DNA segregation ATPase FtsK/SpoIIIE|nr:DNA translocase FtsK 4TM domain-containing protein [Pyrinomonadaceae bacterium]
MATTQTEARAKAATQATTTGAPRNTRRNEIIAIALCALGVLLTLCLLSYRPNDPSWNSAGQTETRNLIGAIGANVAVTLFQFVGLAAPLLPLLLFAAAWRRFRTRRIHAPLSRIVGLLTLVLAAAALFALFIARPLFDQSVPPGGLAGALIMQVAVSGLNPVGAAILLVAVAAVGLLLATNFSFVRAYERIVAAIHGDRFTLLHNIPERFGAWRAERRERALKRAEARRAARAEREEAYLIETEKTVRTAADRVAEFMRDTDALVVEDDAGQGISAASAIRRSTNAAGATAAAPAAAAALSAQTLGQGMAAELEVAGASAAAAPAQSTMQAQQRATEQLSPGRQARAAAAAAVSARRAATTANDEAAEVEEMVRTASVVRSEMDSEEAATLPAAPERQRRAAASALAPAITDYKMPDAEFLNAPPPHSEQADEELLQLATRLAEKCKEFNVTGQIKHICPGPVVTTYEFKPDPGVKYSRVTGLVDDLCLALKAESIRIDRMPGKPHVGIEVPNPQRETIHLREVLESRQFGESPSKLTIALGKTIDGLNYVADLARMPHLLIAGATGAGKSVGVNSLIVSILYKARPDEVKFILVDPKRLELGLYDGIPHLATPIITDPKRAAISLKWAVSEMERRYKELAGWGVRNIDGFNMEVMRRNMVKDYTEAGEPHKPLPYIVIIIDELADLMMVSGHEVEESITRLAQMARAVGIHLVLATQRPSVDVITGLIKANFPSRISFRVSSKVDSRTIIDANGAEQLLGRGDMLFLPPGTSRLVRVHGAYVDEAEIGRIVSHIKAQGEPQYDETITQSEEEALGMDGASGERDELFEDALRICVEMKRASTSVLQRRLRIGYGRAAAILDMMEREGYIGQADGARPRPVLTRAFELVADWDEPRETE